MASQSHKIGVADSSSSRHLSQVGLSVNPSLIRYEDDDDDVMSECIISLRLLLDQSYSRLVECLCLWYPSLQLH
jgi:hypothetical protein